MMNIVAFVIGITLPAIGGTLLIALLEGSRPVLVRMERFTLGCLTGITLTMFVTFLLQIGLNLPFNLPVFLAVQILAIIIPAVLIQRRHAWAVVLGSQIPTHSTPQLPSWLRYTGYSVLALIVAKIAITGSVFLLFAPTYLDDTLDNWNMRGRVFFYDQQMTLAMPDEDPVLSPKGVSSYPPAVPLAKTWLSTLAGDWHEPLINSIQIVWYLCALSLVYFGIRRHAGTAWAFTGLVMIAGIPLYLIHGTNSYADVFLSAHIFAALSMLYHAMRTEDMDERLAFLRICGVCTALLPFTKNEAMLVYLPPLLLVTAYSLWQLRRVLPLQKMRSVLLWFAVPFLLVAGPWLLFKWMNGLTFGNGKPFTTLGFSWHENVIQAIAINTFFEGNWLLLLPLVFLLLAWRWRAAFTWMISLSAFFLIVYIGQIGMYVLTDLATEALRQTGYARGLVQITPVMVFIAILLLKDGFPKLWNLEARNPKSEGIPNIEI